MEQSIDGMRGDTGPGRERFTCGVLVVPTVQVPVQPFVRMERPVDPIHTDFDQPKVHSHGATMVGPTSHVLDCIIRPGPCGVFDNPVVHDGKPHVHEQTGLGHSNLAPDHRGRGPGPVCIHLRRGGVDITKIVKDARRAVVHHQAGQ